MGYRDGSEDKNTDYSSREPQSDYKDLHGSPTTVCNCNSRGYPTPLSDIGGQKAHIQYIYYKYIQYIYHKKGMLMCTCNISIEEEDLELHASKDYTTLKKKERSSEPQET